MLGPRMPLYKYNNHSRHQVDHATGAHFTDQKVNFHDASKRVILIHTNL